MYFVALAIVVVSFCAEGYGVVVVVVVVVVKVVVIVNDEVLKDGESLCKRNDVFD